MTAISKIDLAIISDRDTFRNEIDKRKVTPEQPKTLPTKMHREKFIWGKLLGKR